MQNKKFNLYENSILHKQINDIIKSKNNVYIYDICESARTNFISSFDINKKIILVSDETTAILYYNDIKNYSDNVYLYQENDIVFNKHIENIDSIYQNRMNTIEKFLNDEYATIIITVSSLFEKVNSFDEYEQNAILISKKQNLIFDDFVNKILSIGYNRVNTVSMPGE